MNYIVFSYTELSLVVQVFFNFSQKVVLQLLTVCAFCLSNYKGHKAFEGDLHRFIES